MARMKMENNAKYGKVEVITNFENKGDFNRETVKKALLNELRCKKKQ